MESSSSQVRALPVGEPLVSLRRVSRFYRPDKPALFDISFDVFEGEVVYIGGPSGSGKSTLLRLLHLGEVPDTGNILFAGHDVGSLRVEARSVLRRQMGVIFQDFRLVEDLSVSANVALPLEVLGCSRAAIRSRVDEMLGRVGLGGRGGELAAGLSGGEQQRVAIARALIGEPRLVLADEPTGSLDAYIADFVLDLLEETARRGAAVVIATHDRMLMAARPHRTVSLERGRIFGLAAASELLRAEASLVPASALAR